MQNVNKSGVTCPRARVCITIKHTKFAVICKPITSQRMNIQELLALLTAKFSGARKDGLLQLARSLALQCATKEDAEAIVEKLTDAQVSDFIKNYRADVDKEVSDGVKTSETNLRKKYDFKEKTITEPGGGGTDNIADIVKAAVAEAVKPYADRIASMESDNINKTRLQRLNEALASCKDETFKAQTLKDFARMKFDDDSSFDEYLTDKTADIATANQSFADTNMGRSGGSPLFSSKSESGVSQAVADYVASKKPENNQFAGKEL